MFNVNSKSPPTRFAIPDRVRCKQVRTTVEEDVASEIDIDLNVGNLRERIAAAGNPENERVYGYVVRSVRPVNGQFIQTGSAPNWNGGLITLCTCKHSMRASLTPVQWKRGIWIAGLTSWDRDFGKQQSLIYLMRIGEAYASHAELVQALRESGRSTIVDSKASTLNPLGDLMIPAREGIAAADRYSISAYLPPMIGHSHQCDDSHNQWHDDIDYRDRFGRRPSMLVGDPQFSFRWTRPIVRRSLPAPTRPYREWSLESFLLDIEAAA